ncbi:rod-determining factor RdfA [Salinibaculum rarum]|uniref:rod-determining factor RdfA n=1 Tax=Salinibaculum rarum TaxID=3058903 RepID=UPI00265FBBB4|nr:rod-determining factor RdfA [Salinibaculum sp. KK48]
MANETDVQTRYKVGRVLSEHDLMDLHEALPERWLGESGEAESLRALAERINVAVLRQAMEEAGMDPLDGEAENAYRLVTDDDVSVGVRTQQRNRLERAGVDVDQCEDEFVTHQAVYTYLTKALGVSKDDRDETDPLEKHEERIQRLRSRTAAVMENSLTELQNDETITLGSFDTTVDLRVYCQDCETQYELSSLLARGGCTCE